MTKVKFNFLMLLLIFCFSYSSLYAAEFVTVDDCHGKSYTFNAEEADTPDQIHKLSQDCLDDYAKKAAKVDRISKLMDSVSSQSGAFGPLIKFRTLVNSHLDQVLELIKFALTADGDAIANYQLGDLQKKIDELRIQTDRISVSWNEAHYRGLSEEAKELLTFLDDPIVPAELKSKISNLKSHWPKYLLEGRTANSQPGSKIIQSPVPQDDLVLIKRLQTELEMSFSSLRYKWINHQIQSLGQVVATNYISAYEDIDASLSQSKIEDQLQIKSVILSEQRMAFFGVTETAIWRLQSAIDRIEHFLANKNFVLKNKLSEKLKQRSRQLASILDRVQKLNKVQNFKLLLAGQSGLFERLAKIQIQRTALKQRIKYLQQRFESLKAGLATLPFSTDTLKETKTGNGANGLQLRDTDLLAKFGKSPPPQNFVVLLEQNYRQAMELSNALNVDRNRPLKPLDSSKLTPTFFAPATTSSTFKRNSL